jgi:hypothetical protein
MMSFQAKRELLTQVAGRYSEASGRQKSLILDEFVAATGYQRKYAIRLLRRPPPRITCDQAPTRPPVWPTSAACAQDHLGGH